MTAIAANNQDFVNLTDCTIFSLTALGGSAIAFLGIAESVSFEIKREFEDVTNSASQSSAHRPIRWGFGSVKITGFSQLAGSKIAAEFAGASHANLMFAESATGDSYQLLCAQETYSKTMGKGSTKDEISLIQEGVPWFGPAGAAPAAMSLGL